MEWIACGARLTQRHRGLDLPCGRFPLGIERSIPLADLFYILQFGACKSWTAPPPLISSSARKNMVSIHATYGALLLGGLFASMCGFILLVSYRIWTSPRLSGLVVLQAIIYFKTYESDRKRIKVLVRISSCFVAGSDQIPSRWSSFCELNKTVRKLQW